MNLKPSENRQLYGMNFVFNDIIKLYHKKKMPNKILLSGKKGLGKSTLAFHIINYILSNSEDFKYDLNSFTINKENKSFKLVQNNLHPNFYLIDLLADKKNIDIGQIREMIIYTNKSTFNNMPRFILIDNIEYLNKNSINALLKVTEELNNNIFFIFIHNSNKNILSTLKSRCISFKIHLSFNSSKNVTNKILNDDVLRLINKDLINYYFTPGNYLNLINFAKKNEINLNSISLKAFLILLIDKNYYKKDPYIEETIYDFIQFYLFKVFVNNNFKNSLVIFYEKFLQKINYTNQFNLDKESLFLEFKLKILNE